MAPFARTPDLAQPTLEPFLQHQWRLHTAHLKQQPRFTACLLRQLQEYLGDKVVLHHADHELQQLRVFCPRQYFTGALNTWQAPELFEPFHTSIHPTLRNTIWHCPPQGQEAVAKRTHHYLLLPFPEWQPPTDHQSSTRHHVTTPFSTTSRAIVQSTTLAPFPLLPHPYTSRHSPLRNQ